MRPRKFFSDEYQKVSARIAKPFRLRPGLQASSARRAGAGSFERALREERSIVLSPAHLAPLGVVLPLQYINCHRKQHGQDNPANSREVGPRPGPSVGATQAVGLRY
jgi:hypothetical protein